MKTFRIEIIKRSFPKKKNVFRLNVPIIVRVHNEVANCDRVVRNSAGKFIVNFIYVKKRG